MITICIQCANFMNLEPDSVRGDVWYNHLCSAFPLPVEIDPYDGQEKRCRFNDLGKRYFTHHLFDYCRNHNNGDCPRFQ